MSWFGKKKQKQKQYSGFPGDCSQEQIQTLAKFRKHVQSNKKVPIQQFDDPYLLRFLRARKFDLQKTIKMWNDFIDWRVKNQIDNFKNFKFPELPQLRKMYPHGYHKVDKQFRPIYIERVGCIDVDKIFKVMQTDNMLQYYAVLYQTLLTTIFDGCTKVKQLATGQTNKVTQTLTILDLKHVKLGSASKAYDFVKPVSAMAQNNYPQILGNMFIVNAPMLFTGIWTIVKMWIDDKTKQKIKILGSNYKKQLSQYIDPQNLPAFLDGGKCQCNGKQCRLEANIGPWNPQGKQMFYNNIHLQIKPQHIQHPGYHKQQILLSSPDVVVQIQVKDEEKPVISHKKSPQHQQDQVLQKVSSIDMSNNENEENRNVKIQNISEEKTDTKPVHHQQVSEGTQTQVQTQKQIHQYKQLQQQQQVKVSQQCQRQIESLQGQGKIKECQNEQNKQNEQKKQDCPRVQQDGQVKQIQQTKQNSNNNDVNGNNKLTYSNTSQ